ncbi:MAG: hypothetical protein MI717_04360 [Spirochaetales bacterium]|nr:hypothetical protein [Spirochaetales bacterium]
MSIQVLLTPSHRPGSISLIVDEEVALVGDLMVGFPFQYFPPYGQNPQEIWISWQTLLQSSCPWFCPFHGSIITRNQLQSWIEKIEAPLPHNL